MFQVLTLILLERKLVIQSHDYSALSFCILSLTKMIYPMEYVFPVIPLLPISLQGSEQVTRQSGQPPCHLREPEQFLLKLK